MYTDNFCFGYIAVSCFFETFPGGWLGVENSVVSLDLDLDFGLRLRVCQKLISVDNTIDLKSLTTKVKKQPQNV